MDVRCLWQQGSFFSVIFCVIWDNNFYKLHLCKLSSVTASSKKWLLESAKLSMIKWIFCKKSIRDWRKKNMTKCLGFQKVHCRQSYEIGSQPPKTNQTLEKEDDVQVGGLRWSNTNMDQKDKWSEFINFNINDFRKCSRLCFFFYALQIPSKRWLTRKVQEDIGCSDIIYDESLTQKNRARLFLRAKELILSIIGPWFQPCQRQYLDVNIGDTDRKHTTNSTGGSTRKNWAFNG